MARISGTREVLEHIKGIVKSLSEDTMLTLQESDVSMTHDYCQVALRFTNTQGIRCYLAVGLHQDMPTHLFFVQIICEYRESGEVYNLHKGIAHLPYQEYEYDEDLLKIILTYTLNSLTMVTKQDLLRITTP